MKMGARLIVLLRTSLVGLLLVLALMGIQMSTATPTVPPPCSLITGHDGDSFPDCITNAALPVVDETVTNTVTKCEPLDEPVACATAVASSTVTCNRPALGTTQCSAVNGVAYVGSTATTFAGHLDGSGTSVVYLRSTQTSPYVVNLDGNCDWGSGAHGCSDSHSTGTYTDMCYPGCTAAFASASASATTRATIYFVGTLGYSATASTDSVYAASCPGNGC